MHPDKKIKGVNPLRWIEKNYKNVVSVKAKQKKRNRQSGTKCGRIFILMNHVAALLHIQIAFTVVDPDNIEDLRRISEDMILISCLAEYLIENEMKISRSV